MYTSFRPQEKKSVLHLCSSTPRGHSSFRHALKVLFCHMRENNNFGNPQTRKSELEKVITWPKPLLTAQRSPGNTSSSCRKTRGLQELPLLGCRTNTKTVASTQLRFHSIDMRYLAFILVLAGNVIAREVIVVPTGSEESTTVCKVSRHSIFITRSE